MDPAALPPGAAVSVKAADDFFRFIDGWKGVIGTDPWTNGMPWVHCLNPEGTPVKFLIPPDQLEPRHDEDPQN